MGELFGILLFFVAELLSFSAISALNRSRYLIGAIDKSLWPPVRANRTL
jgi:hypothetical protein